MVLLKEQRVTLRLRGTRRSLCLMRGSRCSMLGRQTAAIPSAEDQHCLAFKGDGPWEVESSGSSMLRGPLKQLQCTLAFYREGN